MDGLVDLVSNADQYDEVSGQLLTAFENFGQHIVDETIRKNAKFHYNAGLSPKIVRRAEGKCCPWCRGLAGVHDYPDVDRDVYRRHENCRCTVLYDPADGSKSLQNVHSKVWTDRQKYDTVALKKSDYATEASRIASNGSKYGKEAVKVDESYIRSQEYRMRFRGITGDDKTEDRVAEQCRRILKVRSGTLKESLVLLNYDTGAVLGTVFDSKRDNQISYSQQILKAIESAKQRGIRILAIHNHPEGLPPTADDCASAFYHGYTLGVVCGHNGSVFSYGPSGHMYSTEVCNHIHHAISLQCGFLKEYDEIVDLWIDMMQSYGLTIERR